MPIDFRNESENRKYKWKGRIQLRPDMKIQSVITMLNTFFDSSSPFDIVMSKYFKNNKWIGSSERREIAEFCYLIFRNYEKLNFLAEQYLNSVAEQKESNVEQSNEPKVKSLFLIIGCLRFVKNNDAESIKNLFNNSENKHSELPKLSRIEAGFIEADVFDKFSCFDCNDTAISNNLPEYVELNYPLWMEPYFERAFGNENFEKEMAALNSKTLVNIRVNTLKIASRDEFLKGTYTYNNDNLRFEPTKLAPNGLKLLEGRISRNYPIIKDGLAEIQDEGSQLIAEICCRLPQNAGLHTFIDFCAGAGGKTLAVAAFMKNKGRIFALDKYPERLENAKKRFRRSGVNNVTCQEICGKWLKRHKACGDVVLVDAPCSGTGTWRRNPDMRVKFKPRDLEELLKVQQEILETAAPLVKIGGYLVYSTCSILLNENDDQIAHFLENHSNFKHKKIQIFQKTELNGDFLRLSPFRNDTDGFFAAVLERLA